MDLVRKSIFGDDYEMSLEIAEEVMARQPPEAQAIIRLLWAEIQRLRGELAAAKAELAVVQKTPRNSSLPPSSEHPHAKPAAAKRKKKKQRGGQPGHEKHDRALLPAEQCQDVVVCKPKNCRWCGRPLTGSDPAPLRHPRWEVPEIKPLVTEYQRHRLPCDWGATTCGKVPPGVPASQAGPRLVALVALLMGSFRQSKRRVALCLAQVLGQPCSPGGVVKLQNQATAALRPAYDELAKQLPDEPPVGLDESPTQQGPHKAWLGTAVAPKFTVCALRTTRAATVLTELLGGNYGGVINCDRANRYCSQPRLPWCWAHLKRDFQALMDSTEGVRKRLGHDLMRPTRTLFQRWVRYRDGTLTRVGF